MQSPNSDIQVIAGTTLQGVEIHLIDDIELLADILNKCDHWTELDGIFLCVNGKLTGLFTYDPKAKAELTQAEAAS